jgi:hypothetical protein
VRLRLDLVSRSGLLGRVRDSLGGAGSLTRPVSLTARARTALRGLRGLRLRVRVRAVDDNGNVRTVSRVITLR